MLHAATRRLPVGAAWLLPLLLLSISCWAGHSDDGLQSDADIDTDDGTDSDSDSDSDSETVTASDSDTATVTDTETDSATETGDETCDGVSTRLMEIMRPASNDLLRLVLTAALLSVLGAGCTGDCEIDCREFCSRDPEPCSSDPAHGTCEDRCRSINRSSSPGTCCDVREALAQCYERHPGACEDQDAGCGDERSDFYNCGRI